MIKKQRRCALIHPVVAAVLEQPAEPAHPTNRRLINAMCHFMVRDVYF